MRMNFTDVLCDAYVCGLSTYAEAMLNYELHARPVMTEPEQIASDQAVYGQLEQLLDAGLLMDEDYLVTNAMRSYDE